MAKLVFVVTSPMTVAVLLRGQLAALQDQGFEVSVICGLDSHLQYLADIKSVQVYEVPLEREISPIRDLQALLRIFLLLKRLKPDIVNASTPKASLLGMIAARFLNVPVRVYQQRGLRLETVSGFMRVVLVQAEKLTAHCAHKIVCNSFSLKNIYQQHKFASESKVLVIGAGSSNGVDLRRFHLPTQDQLTEVACLRNQLGILPDAKIIGFVGRLTRDKGIEDLVQAFEKVAKVIENVQMLLVGPLESGDALQADLVSKIQSDSRIKRVEFTNDLTLYYYLMDLLAFPSFREGFPNVPLEASACGIPVVGYSATGTVDAVVHNKTGVLTSIGDIDKFSKAMVMLLQNDQLRNEMGRSAHDRAVKDFEARTVWKRWAEFYYQCLDEL